MSQRRWSGFTIIEMVGVIAVVLVLIVLVWPTCTCGNFRRPAARKSACLSNLKQIGLAAAMYVQDYDDTLFWNPAPGGLAAESAEPSSPTGDCAPQPKTSFAVLLRPYARNSRVFHCPSYGGHALRHHLGYARSLTDAAARSSSDPGLSAPDDPAWFQKIGYGFNEVLVGGPCRPRKVSSLRHAAAEVALLSDAERPWASSTGVWVREEGGWSRYWRWDPAVEPRHEGGQNFVYVDGHARFLKPVAKGDDATEGYFSGAKLE